MKKLFSLLLAVLMLSACLVGCVQSGNTPGNNSETTPGGDPGTTPGGTCRWSGAGADGLHRTRS